MARRVAVLMKKTISGRWTVWATLREVMQKEVHFAVGGGRWSSSFRSRFTRRVAWRSTVSKDTRRCSPSGSTYCSTSSCTETEWFSDEACRPVSVSDKIAALGSRGQVDELAHNRVRQSSGW
jgi:hypothetical protein